MRARLPGMQIGFSWESVNRLLIFKAKVHPVLSNLPSNTQEELLSRQLTVPVTTLRTRLGTWHMVWMCAHTFAYLTYLSPLPPSEIKKQKVKTKHIWTNSPLYARYYRHGNGLQLRKYIRTFAEASQKDGGWVARQLRDGLNGVKCQLPLTRFGPRPL